MICKCGGMLLANGLSGKYKDRQRFICRECRETSTWKDGIRQTKRGRPLKAYQPFLIDWAIVKRCCRPVDNSVDNSVDKCATLCSAEHPVEMR